MKKNQTIKQDRPGTSMFTENKKLKNRVQELENQIEAQKKEMVEKLDVKWKSTREFENMAYQRIGKLTTDIKGLLKVIDFYKKKEKQIEDAVI